MTKLSLPTAYQFVNLIGNRYGRLLIKDYAGKNSQKKTQWLCICDCGVEKIISSADIKAEKIVSCGCHKNESASKRFSTHKLCKSSEYSSWAAMINRCTNKKLRDYKNYGGRGIVVCDRWRDSFEDFLLDMGNKPSQKHSIDRIDVNGNYQKSNCRWADDFQQARNARSNIVIEFNNKKMVLSEAAEIYGINYGTLISRYRKGWTVDEMLTIPASYHNKKTHFKNNT